MLLTAVILAFGIAAAPAAVEADSESIFKRCCAHYSALPGFSVTLEYTPPATPLVGPDMAQKHRLDFRGAKPNKISITQHIPGVGAMDIISDGHRLVMSLPARTMFSRHAAPEDMEQARREIPLGGAVDGMSDLCFNLLATDPALALLADAQRMASGGSTTIDDATCDIVRLHPNTSPYAPPGMSIDLLIAQGQEPWILGYDLNLPALPERGMPNDTTIEIRAREWKPLDADAEVFTFTADDAVEVESVVKELRKQAGPPAPPPPVHEIAPPGTTP